MAIFGRCVVPSWQEQPATCCLTYERTDAVLQVLAIQQGHRQALGKGLPLCCSDVLGGQALSRQVQLLEGCLGQLPQSLVHFIEGICLVQLACDGVHEVVGKPEACFVQGVGVHQLVTALNVEACECSLQQDT